MVSLKERVHTWRKYNPAGTKQQLYREFKDENKNSLRTYYNSYEPFLGDISNDIILNKFDTIKEMTYTVQQILDPVKRAENIARLHNMLLKPIANKEEKSLKEMFETL